MTLSASILKRRSYFKQVFVENITLVQQEQKMGGEQFSEPVMEIHARPFKRLQCLCPVCYYSQSCALHFWNIQIYFTNLNKNMREGGDLISAASPQNFIKSIWITVTQTHKGSHLVNSITLACFYIALYRCIVLRIFLSLKLSGHFQMSL